MYCIECGIHLEEESNFCPECGAKVPDLRTQHQAQPSRPAEEAIAAIRACEWCTESIPLIALRCPRCQKWRKDIDRERVLTYVWGGAAILPTVLFIAGLRGGWWHESVDSGSSPLFESFASEFSINAFLSSGSGIAVLIGFVVTGLLSFYYYAKVSTKIGSWWWF